MAFAEINDPKGQCKDVTNLGRWGDGDVKVGLESLDGDACTLWASCASGTSVKMGDGDQA